MAAVIVVLVIVLLVLCAGAYLISYNRFVSQRNLVAESWRQVDVELQRRFELIPNLVRTVQGYAAHERETLAAAVAARDAANAHAAGSPGERAAYEQELGRTGAGLLALAEAYPELKASANFLALQQELVTTEDRIAAARRFYNGNVRAYNTRIEAVPSSLVAHRHHLRPAEYFQVDDQPGDSGARAAVTTRF